MADNDNKGFSTRCIHAGETLDVQGGIHMPLYNHSTFAFKNTEDLLDVVEGRNPDGNLYTRYGLNPTIRGLEKKCTSLEGGEGCLAFSSGMAAEAATFLAHCNAGDHIICIGDVYGGTFDLLNENLPTLGIETTFVLGHELAELPQQFRETTRLVFFETPTNPNLEVLDILKIAAVAKEHGALTVVDNTFASPVNQQPFELGADIVVSLSVPSELDVGVFRQQLTELSEQGSTGVIFTGDGLVAKNSELLSRALGGFPDLNLWMATCFPGAAEPVLTLCAALPCQGMALITFFG